MQVEERETWAQEIIRRAADVRYHDGLDSVKADGLRFNAAVKSMAERLQDECKAEGRERPHADVQRSIDKSFAQVGKVQLAIAEATLRVAEIQGNKDKYSHAPGSAFESKDINVIPSRHEYDTKAQSIGS